MASSQQLFWLVDLTLDVYVSIWSLDVPHLDKSENQMRVQTSLETDVPYSERSYLDP